MDSDLRWKQRLANFGRAVELLREPLVRDPDSLSALEKEGSIQRFEVALELAWKTLKDSLEHEGRSVAPITPRSVIKDGFAARVVLDGAIWMERIDQRNLLSHTYDAATSDKAFRAIRERYFRAIEELYEGLRARSTT